jgi:hypothetical protein
VRATKERLGPEQQGATVTPVDPTAVGERGDEAVGALPGDADHLGHLLLGQPYRDAHLLAVTGGLPVLLRQLQQLSGEPGGGVEEDEVLRVWSARRSRRAMSSNSRRASSERVSSRVQKVSALKAKRSASSMARADIALAPRSMTASSPKIWPRPTTATSSSAPRRDDT